MMKKLLCLLAALIIGTSGVWAAITTPFVPTTGAYYSLKEKTTGLYVNIVESSEHKKDVVLGNTAEAFTFTSSGSSYTIKNISGDYIGKYTNNTWNMDSRTSENWTIIDAGDGDIKLSCDKGQMGLDNYTEGSPFYRNKSEGCTFEVEEIDLQDIDYTLHVTGAPAGTVISYRGDPYQDGDVITINGIPSLRDFVPSVIAHYTSSISVDPEAYTITVVYTHVVGFSGKADATIQQASEGYFTIAGMAQNGVTTNFLYDNGGQVLAKGFVEDEQDMYWHAESVGNGMYTFKNVGTGKYLNIASANDQPITTSDTPQSLYFVISASVACIHNGSTAIDVAYAGTSPVAWSGTVPEGSRRLLIYEAILSNPDATYTYTINILGAPNGTKVEFNGLQLASGDTFQAVGSSVTEDAFTIPTVHQCYDGVVTINGFNVTITYTAWPTYSAKVINSAEGGVTYESQNYTNGQAIIAETFNEDLVGVIPVEGYASRVQIADNTITVYYMPIGTAFTDGEKIAIVGTCEETAIVPGKWYVMTQLRGGETPIYDLGAGQNMKREAAANTHETLFPGTASEKTQYLLRFFETSVEGAYTIQFANGNYWNGVNTSANAADARYYFVHTATQTQAGAPSTKGWVIINTPDLEAYGSRVDNDVNGNMVYWESGNFSEGTNNVFYLYNVDFVTEVTYTVSVVGNEAGAVTYDGTTYNNEDEITVTTFDENLLEAIPIEGYSAVINIAGTTITVTYTKEATIPEDGKTYYIYSDNKSTTTGGANAPDAHYYLYYNGSNLALSDTRLESDAYMWTCTKVGDKYTFRNVQTETYMGFKVMSNSAYNLSISADAAQTDGCVTIYGDAASRYLVIPNGGSGFDQGIRTYNKGTTNYSSDFVFEECTSSLQYYIIVQIIGGIGSVEIDGQTYNDGDAFTRMTDIEESNVHPTEISNQNANIAIYRTGRTITIVCIYSPLYDFSQSGTPTQVRYWFDTDGEVQTADYAPGAININASTLDMGIHALYYQVTDDNGQLSPVRFANFYRLPAEGAEDLGLSGTPTQVHYWFDTDGEVHTSAYAAGAISIDASALEMGIHALYYQVVDDKGQLSPVRFANFYRLPAEGAEDLGLSGTPTQVRYWFDTDGEVHTSDYAAGAVSIDASSLEMGIHALYYQVVDDKGQLSPVRFANFYRLPAEDAEDLGLSGTPTQVRYWADTDHEHMQQTAYVAGHTIINLSMFGEGEPGEQHVLRYQVIDDKGNMSPVRYVGYIYDKHQQVIVLEEWEVLKRFHDASVQQGEWTRNAWTMTEGRGETADESLERLPGVSLVDGHVRSIDLSQSGITGDVLSLAELPELEHLNLSGNAIANVELPLIPETATADLRSQSLTDTKSIVWDTPTEQSLTEDLPNIMRLSADARLLAEQYTWTLWNAPTATGWRMSLVMKDAMPELRQVSSRIYDNANGGTVTLQVATGIAAGTTLPVQFHYLEGDANLSGAVDVLDVQTVVNESFGIGTGLLNKQAADLQADGSLNVLDLVRVVNVLLAQAMPSSEAATRHMAKAPAQHESYVFLECTDGSLLLESSERVGALDLWLRLPQGSTEDDVENLLAGFDVATRLSGNLCHVVLYSPMGIAMDGMGEALLSLPQGTTLLRASAADAEANSLSVSMGQTTGIVDVTAPREAATAYDLQGRLSIARGLHIAKQRGIYTKSITK